MNVYYRWNLDLHFQEKFPATLPCRPMVGDYIRSNFSHPKTKIRLELVVVRIAFIQMAATDTPKCEVELHLPPNRYLSIEDFQKSYRNW